MDSFETRLNVLKPQFLPNYPQKTLTEAELRAMEQQIGNPLPADYRAFLAIYGGVYFIHGSSFLYGDGDGSSRAARFYGKLPDAMRDLLSIRSDYVGRIPSDLLPIAGDGGANQICIGLTGERAGKVYFWDHEEEGLPEEYIDEDEEPSDHNVYHIADSFDAFFLNLRTHAENEAEEKRLAEAKGAPS